MVQFGAPFPHFESLLADVIVSLATEGMYERGVIIVMIIAIETMFNASSSDFHESHDRVWCRLGGGQLPSPRHDATGQKDVKRLCVCTCLQLADSTFQSASFSTRKRDSTEASDLDA